MLLSLSDREMRDLRAFLDGNEDCEALSECEYVADLYDIEAPLTINLVFCEKGVRIDGACYLGYDSEMEGYYIDRPIEDAQPVLYALREAGAFCAES